MRNIEIGSKIVGDGYPCLVSFEPGATHTGLKSAKKLADATANAGADMVKFQTVRADELMIKDDHSLMIDYGTKDGTKKESIYSAIKRRELSYKEWHELKTYCDKLGLLFISTPSGPSTLDLLVDMNVDAVKVISSDINNIFLIREIAKKHLPVVLDAREKFSEVETAFRICHSEGNRDIIIMHCPSGYPTRYSDINFGMIPYIKGIFNCPVAYSDHTPGTIMNYVALGFGANFIEKTITLNRFTDAVEHYMSLEPGELKDFVDNIRNIELGFGNPRSIFSSNINRNHRRSIVTSIPISKGEVISLSNITFKRPGTHISVDMYPDIIGKKAVRDIEGDVFLGMDDFE